MTMKFISEKGRGWKVEVKRTEITADEVSPVLTVRLAVMNLFSRQHSLRSTWFRNGWS